MALVAEGIPSVPVSEAASEACTGRAPASACSQLRYIDGQDGQDSRSCREFCRKISNHRLYQEEKKKKKEKQDIVFAAPCQTIGVNSTFKIHSSRTAALRWWT